MYRRGGGSDGHQHARASEANAIGHYAPAVLYDLEASQKERKGRGRLSGHERSNETAAPAHLEVLRGPHVGQVGLDAGQDIEFGVDDPAHDAVCVRAEMLRVSIGRARALRRKQRAGRRRTVDGQAKHVGKDLDANDVARADVHVMLRAREVRRGEGQRAE